MSSGSATAASLQGDLRDDEIDLLEYVRVLRERWHLVGGTMLGVLVVTLIFTLLATPIYRAVATLQIERDTAKVVEFDGVQPVESPMDRDFYQTQYELLKSRSLARRVIQDLRLTSVPEYARQLKEVDESLAEKSGGKQVSPATRQRAREDVLVKTVLDALTIEPVRNSRLVRINYDAADPALAARAANAYADAFIASNLERRFEVSSYARKYLEERLAQLKGRLEDSERALVAFAESEHIVSVGEDKPSLDAQSLGDLNASLVATEGARMKAEAMWRKASRGDGMGLPQVVSNELIQTLRQQRAKLLADYGNRSATYKPDYPDMVRLRKEIDETERQIQAEVGNIRNAIQAEYQAAAAQENLLRQRIGVLKSDVIDLQNRSIKYNILRRETETNRQLYDALLQRYKEIGIAGGIGANNMTVIDRAVEPERAHSPRKALNLLGGLLAGAMLGVVLAFLARHLDNTIHEPRALEAMLGLPVLGAVPRLESGTTPAEASVDTRSPFVEAYRSVRTALQFATLRGLPRSLLITSANPAEGKSTTAHELARNIAQLGKRVVLVDADLRNPSVHRICGLSPMSGLSNVLTGACELEQVMQQAEHGGLHVITSGPLPPNPPELLAGDALPRMLAQLNEMFDVVVIDGPPVLGLADAPLISHCAEATLLVVAADRTRVDAVRGALKRLQSVKASVLGAVLSHFDLKHKGHLYGGRDYYAYGGESES